MTQPTPTEPFPSPSPRPPFPNAPYPGGPRRCQYCAKPADLYDVDGSWCSPQCQTYDRQAEITWWRKAVTR